MQFFNLIRQKKTLLRELLTEDAATNFVHAFSRHSKESPFGVGQIIHTERLGIPFGPFEIIGLKAGGQAIIYTVLAENRSSIYALKTFQNWCYEERGMFERFMREAETMIDLGWHPNLLHAHAVFLISGRPYVLLEYVAGFSLRQKLRAGALLIQDVLRYAIEVCRGLAHAQRILPTFVHRDIKPDNCLVTNEGVLKIGDFGQAKTSRSKGNGAGGARTQRSSKGSRITLADHWGAGTLEYMAPEQFDTASAHDVRTDVYSFGVLLFELLTRKLPFNATEHREYFEKHRNQPPPDPRTINNEIPHELSRLVLSCLAKSKDARPTDFVELEEELQRIYWSITGGRLPAMLPKTEGPADSFQHAFSLLQFQRYDEAIQCFDLPGAVKPRGQIFKSIALAAKNELEDAEELIDRVLVTHPKNSLAYTQKGELLAKRGSFREAIQFFDLAIALEPKFVTALNHEAECLIALGQLQSATSICRTSLAIEPNQNVASRNLGMSYQQQAQHEQALDNYLKAVIADPRDTTSLVELANELARAGRYLESIDSLERAIWLTEGNLDRELICGEITNFFHSGIEVVLEAVGRNASTLFGTFVVAAYLNAINTEELGSISDELIAGMRDWRSWQKAQLTNCLLGLSNRSKAAFQLPKTQHAIGRILFELKRYAHARAIFASLLEEDPDDSKALYFLAACNEREGNYAVARELYQRALRSDPGSTDILEAIAKLAEVPAAELRIQAAVAKASCRT